MHADMDGDEIRRMRLHRRCFAQQPARVTVYSLVTPIQNPRKHKTERAGGILFLVGPQKIALLFHMPNELTERNEIIINRKPHRHTCIPYMNV